MLYCNAATGIREGEIVAEFHIPFNNTTKEETVEPKKYVFEVRDEEYGLLTESLILTYKEAVARRQWAFDFYTYPIVVSITEACPECGYTTYSWEDGMTICLNHPECNWSNEYKTPATKQDVTTAR